MLRKKPKNVEISVESPATSRSNRPDQSPFERIRVKINNLNLVYERYSKFIETYAEDLIHSTNPGGFSSYPISDEETLRPLFADGNIEQYLQYERSNELRDAIYHALNPMFIITLDSAAAKKNVQSEQFNRVVIFRT